MTLNLRKPTKSAFNKQWETCRFEDKKDYENETWFKVSLLIVKKMWPATGLWHSGRIQLFRKRLSETNVHATIPKGNMGYDQYTVPDYCTCRTYFCCFSLAHTNIRPWPLVPLFQISSSFHHDHLVNIIVLLNLRQKRYAELNTINSCLAHTPL